MTDTSFKDTLVSTVQFFHRRPKVISSNVNDAIDGIQSAALYILQKPKRFIEVKNKRSYLAMVARGRIRDMKKSKAKTRIYNDSDQEFVVIDSEEFSFVDAIIMQTDLGQISSVEHKIDLDTYKSHLKSIGKQNRRLRGFEPGEAIILSSHGLTNKEIADMYDTDMDTVRYSINYFRKRYGLRS